MADLKEMMLRSPTYFCAIARPDWIAELKEKNEDVLAATIDAAAGMCASVVGGIFSHSEVSLPDLVSLCANDNLTAPRIARIFDYTKASRVQQILDDPNISIQKGQEIADEMKVPMKIGSGGRRCIIADDWNDNRLERRFKASYYPTDIDKIAAIFRPEWNILSGSPNVRDGQLRLGGGDGVIVSLTYLGTRWAYYPAGHWPFRNRFHFIRQDGDNYWMLWHEHHAVTKKLALQKVVGGSATEVGSTSDSGYGYLWEVTRDEDGNWEVFRDGVSKITATDTWLPTMNEVCFYTPDDNADIDYFWVM